MTKASETDMHEENYINVTHMNHTCQYHTGHKESNTLGQINFAQQVS